MTESRTKLTAAHQAMKMAETTEDRFKALADFGDLVLAIAAASDIEDGILMAKIGEAFIGAQKDDELFWCDTLDDLWDIIQEMDLP